MHSDAVLRVCRHYRGGKNSQKLRYGDSCLGLTLFDTNAKSVSKPRLAYVEPNMGKGFEIFPCDGIELRTFILTPVITLPFHRLLKYKQKLAKLETMLEELSLRPNMMGYNEAKKHLDELAATHLATDVYVEKRNIHNGRRKQYQE